MEQVEEQVKEPPPINVKGISDFNKFCANVEILIGRQNVFYRSRLYVITVQTNSCQNYRDGINYLKQLFLEVTTIQNAKTSLVAEFKTPSVMSS